MCVSVGQESRRSSSTARGCAPGSSAQGSSAQPGSVLQRERGSEGKRRPSKRWIPTGSYCSGNLRRIREFNASMEDHGRYWRSELHPSPLEIQNGLIIMKINSFGDIVNTY